MLIFAEGTVNEPLSDVERAAVRAWLGPMVDEGFIQSGYISTWLVIGYGSWFLRDTLTEDTACWRHGTAEQQQAAAPGQWPAVPLVS